MSIPKIQAYGLVNYEGPLAGRYVSDIISKCDKHGYSLKWAGYYYVKKERTIPVMTKSHNMYYSINVYTKLCEMLNVSDDNRFRLIFVREHDGNNVFLCSCKFNDRTVMKLADKADIIIKNSKECSQEDADAMWESLKELDGEYFDIEKDTLSSLL